jgi:hypothetical protein
MQPGAADFSLFELCLGLNLPVSDLRAPKSAQFFLRALFSRKLPRHPEKLRHQPAKRRGIGYRLASSRL